MVPQEKPPNALSARQKAWIILRAAGVGALREEIRYLRILLILLASVPMACFGLVPPDSVSDYRPDAGAWACRIVFGGLALAVNAAGLLADDMRRVRPYKKRIYIYITLIVVVGTPLAYAMRLLFID